MGLQAKCDGSVGSVCSRCRHLESKVNGDTRRRADNGSLAQVVDGLTPFPVQLLVEPSEEMISLPRIMFLELGTVSTPPFGGIREETILTRYTTGEVQDLLVALRGEIDQVSQFSSGESLESLFGGNLVCYIDDKGFFSHYSTTSSAVGIKRLATTATAAAASGANIVAPALNGIQLDGFSGRRLPSYMSKMDAFANFDASSSSSSVIVTGKTTDIDTA